MKRLSLVLFLLLLSVSPVWATTRIIGVGGSGSTCSYASPCTWATAYAASVTGDTIQLKGGTYDSSDGVPWTISKSGITVTRYGTESPVIDGEPTGTYPERYGTVPTKGSYGGLIDISGNNNTVQYLTVQFSGGRNINITGDSNTISRNKIYSSYRQGICVSATTSASENNVIEHNDVVGNSLQWIDQGYSYPTSVAISLNGNGASLAASGNTVRYNYVAENWGEGIDCLKNSRNNTIEYNIVMHNLSAQIYMDRDADSNTARYNLIYGITGSTVTTANGGHRNAAACFSQNDEAAPVPSSENKIYGNLCANTNVGLNMATKATGSLIDRNFYYNNTIIDCIGGVQEQGGVPASEFSGVQIKNNAFLILDRTGCTLASMPSTTDSQVDFANNYWSSAPDADVRDSTDYGYSGYSNGDPGLNDSSVTNWSNLSRNQLTGQEFATLSTGKLVGAGATLASPYNQILNLDNSNYKIGCGVSGTGASAFSLVTQSDYGVAEIGADVYVTSGGTVPSTPTGFTAGTPTQTTCSVSWTAVTDATRYQIQYGATSTWPDTGTTTVGEITGTSYTLTGLTADTAYTARVLASNQYGNSSYSTTATFTTSAISSGDILNEDCSAIADWTLSGGETIVWSVSSGRCTASDNHATEYAKMSRTVTGGLPSEYTVHIEDSTFTALPDTYTSTTYLYLWFANGETRNAIAFADDGIYLKNSSNADVLVASTSSYTTTDGNIDWDIIVKDDPDTAYNLVTIYRAGTLVTQINDFPAGDDYTLNDGLVAIETRGSDSDTSTWSFTAITITEGAVYPDTPVTGHTTSYYAVDDCGDIKTGTPTITVADGVGTFSVAQTNAALDTHGAKGFEVTFGAGSTKCYVSSAISQSVYNLVDANGDACGNATAQTVASFQPPFATLASFVANVDGAGYLTSGNLGELDVDVHAYLGPRTETITSSITIDTFSGTSAEDSWTLHGSSGYTLDCNGVTGLIIQSNHGRLHNLQITHSAVGGTYRRSILLDTGADTVVDMEIVNPKLRGLATNSATGHDGITMSNLEAAAGSVVKIINADISGFMETDGTAAVGIKMLDADAKTYVYRATITNGDVGITSTTSNVVCKNCLSVTLNPYSGDFDTAGSNNASSDTDAPGSTGAVNSVVVTFAVDADGNYKLDPVADYAVFGIGKDLSDDNIYPVTTDRVGTLLATPFSVGAYQSPNSGGLTDELITDLSSSGMAYGTVTVIFMPTYGVAGDSCVFTEGETTLYTDTGCNESEVSIELAPGLHEVTLTASKAGRDDETETISVMVRQSASAWVVASSSGDDVDAACTAGFMPEPTDTFLLSDTSLDLTDCVSVERAMLIGTTTAAVTITGHASKPEIGSWPTLLGPLTLINVTGVEGAAPVIRAGNFGD